jgi:hypothetical protein
MKNLLYYLKAVKTVSQKASVGAGAGARARGVPREDAHDARASPPPQPERLVMRGGGG